MATPKKKKTSTKSAPRSKSKSASKSHGPVKASQSVRPARRVVQKVPVIKAKTRSEKSAPAPFVKMPKLPAHLIAAVKALDEKQAAEVRVLELGQISSVADFLVIATGTSEPHLRALRMELERTLDECGVSSRSESQKDSGWTVVDAFDILFHIFREDTRRSYALESLWKDGLDIPVSAILKA